MIRSNLFVLVFCLLAAGPLGASVFDEIADRIKKVGEVCVEGQACSEALASADAGSSSGHDIGTTYKMTCGNCHAGQLPNSPKTGDVAAWAPRIAKGIDSLYNTALNGLPPLMPPRGTCASCTDDDLKALVDYMVDASK